VIYKICPAIGVLSLFPASRKRQNLFLIRNIDWLKSKFKSNIDLMFKSVWWFSYLSRCFHRSSSMHNPVNHLPAWFSFCWWWFLFVCAVAGSWITNVSVVNLKESLYSRLSTENRKLFVSPQNCCLIKIQKEILYFNMIFHLK